jgi:hypothetical protein
MVASGDCSKGRRSRSLAVEVVNSLTCWYKSSVGNLFVDICCAARMEKLDHDAAALGIFQYVIGYFDDFDIIMRYVVCTYQQPYPS